MPDMGFPRPCRYDATHGEFGSAVQLGQHYREAHEHDAVYARPKGLFRCRLCGAVVGVPQSHYHYMHHDYELGDLKIIDLYEPVAADTPRPRQVRRRNRDSSVTPEHRRRRQCDLCGAVTRSDNMGRHFSHVHPDARSSWASQSHFVRDDPPSGLSRVSDQLERLAAPGVHDAQHPWHVDDIVIPAMEQLAKPSGMIPVAHLAAVLAWRDATAAMLRAVTGSS